MTQMRIKDDNSGVGLVIIWSIVNIIYNSLEENEPSMVIDV